MSDEFQMPAAQPEPDLGRPEIEGKEGWVFLGDVHYRDLSQATGRHPIDPRLLNDTISTLTAMSRYCERRGATFVLGLVPSKAAIYPDKLPDGLQRTVQVPTLRDQIIEGCREAGVRCPDLAAALRKARERGDPYSPLNSHWNNFGALIGWKMLSDELRQAGGHTFVDPFPDDPPLHTHESAAEFSTFGKTDLTTCAISDFGQTPLVRVAPDGSAFQVDPSYEPSLVEWPHDIYAPAAANALTCLVMTDSMGERISPFLNAAFRQLHYRRHHLNELEAAAVMSDHLSATNADVVVYLMVDRYGTEPFHEADFWQALDTFERQIMVAEAAWPNGTEPGALRVSGMHNLGQANCIHLTNWLNKGHNVIRLTVDSEGESLVMTAWHREGQPVQKWHRAGPGRSQIYVLLDAPADQGHFWIVRDNQRALAVLSEVRVRSFS